MKLNQILHGDIRAIAPTLPDGLANCIVTSPPYWGLRDYGHSDQIGLEPTPEEYVSNLVGIFRELRRVLKDDGTLWLNLGDSYAGNGNKSLGRNDAGRNLTGGGGNKHGSGNPGKQGAFNVNVELPPKNLVGIPWRVALALQADGWYLRSDIVWSKTNPMPESVTDRPTKSHEYLFLLAKSERYYYDQDAIREPIKTESIARLARGVSDNHKNIDGAPGQTPHSMNQPRKNRNNATTFKRNGSKREQTIPGQGYGTHRPDRDDTDYNPLGRNKWTVWEISTKPYSGAHFAVFPPDLIEPCILAGCPPDGLVLDPFFGSGTVGEVCVKTGRNWLGVELNQKYITLANQRINGTQLPLIVPGSHVCPTNHSSGITTLPVIETG